MYVLEGNRLLYVLCMYVCMYVCMYFQFCTYAILSAFLNNLFKNIIIVFKFDRSPLKKISLRIFQQFLVGPYYITYNMLLFFAGTD